MPLYQRRNFWAEDDETTTAIRAKAIATEVSILKRRSTVCPFKNHDVLSESLALLKEYVILILIAITIIRVILFTGFCILTYRAYIKHWQII
jgi:hypothetical protein